MFRFIRSIVFALALVPLAAFAAEVDINTASVEQLEQVKGIGPVKANAIVQYRSENGAFASLDELVKVPGIGEKSLAQFRDQLTVSPPAQSATK